MSARVSAHRPRPSEGRIVAWLVILFVVLPLAVAVCCGAGMWAVGIYAVATSP